MALSSWFLRGFLSAALVSGLSFPCFSAPLTYDESVGGDLPGAQGSPISLGTLYLGTNTFRGLGSRSSDTAPGQGDTFKVSLDALHVLTSVTLTLTNYTLTDPIVVTFFRPANEPVSFRVFQRLGPTSGNQTINFAIPTPLPAELGFSVQYATSLQPTSYNWQWDVVVAEAPQAVPEASSVYLMAAGLAAIGVWRRRRF